MKVGEDVYISEHAIIRRPHLVSLGNHVAIDEFVVITCGLETGSFIHISPHVSIIGGEHGKLEMGSFCTIAAGSRIICRGDSFDGKGLVSAPGIPDDLKNEIRGEVITMMDFSSIGTNVVLMPDVWLANGVVVGANSLVTHPIEEPWTIWVGSPARKLKNRSSEARLLSKRLRYELLGR